MPHRLIPVVFQGRDQAYRHQDAQNRGQDDQRLDPVQSAREPAHPFPGLQERPSAERAKGNPDQAGDAGEDRDIFTLFIMPV